MGKKINKNLLKDIIKECIAEMLIEGALPITVNAKGVNIVTESLDDDFTGKLNEISQRKLRRENPERNFLLQSKPSPQQYDKTLKQRLKSQFGDMADLFEDTMKNTLQEQSTADRLSGHSMQVEMAHSSNPVMPLEVTEQQRNAWAQMAFADSKPKV